MGKLLKGFWYTDNMHETPKVAKRSNKRQKVKKSEDIKQKTGELYNILSACLEALGQSC